MIVNPPEKEQNESRVLCKIASCNNTIKANRLCDKHLKRIERYDTVKLKNLMMRDNGLKECLVPGCTSKPLSKGKCHCHYTYSLRNNIPVKPKVVKRCGVEGCVGLIRAKRMCSRHLYKFNKGEWLDIKHRDEHGYPLECKIEKFCGVKDCKEPHHSQGMCISHSKEYEKGMNRLKNMSI